MTPGGRISVYGTVISLPTQASALEVGNKLIPLSFALPALTFGSKMYAANPNSAYVINGQTLTPGGQISVDGTRFSLALKASALVIRSSTEPLQRSFALPPITIGSKVYTANSTFEYVIEGKTLTPGGQISVKGTPISMVLDPSALLIASSTQSLVPISTSIGPGRLILEGLGDRVGNAGGSDTDIERTVNSVPTGGDRSPSNSRATGVSVINVTSITSTPATTPSQTAAVPASSACNRWSRSWIGCVMTLSTIFMTLR